MDAAKEAIGTFIRMDAAKEAMGTFIRMDAAKEAMGTFIRMNAAKEAMDPDQKVCDDHVNTINVFVDIIHCLVFI
jgi:hypothetical protein